MICSCVFYSCDILHFDKSEFEVFFHRSVKYLKTEILNASAHMIFKSLYIYRPIYIYRLLHICECEGQLRIDNSINNI